MTVNTDQNQDTTEFLKFIFSAPSGAGGSRFSQDTMKDSIWGNTT